MPSQEELARIIKEMRSQGLSDEEIRETLEDMGVPSEVIESLVGAADKGSSPSASKQSSADSSSDELLPTSESKSSDISLTKPSRSDTASNVPSKQNLLDDIISEKGAAPESKSSSSPVLAQSQPGDAESSSQSGDLFPRRPSPKDAPPESKPAIPPHSDNDFSASIATPPIIEEDSVPSEKIDEIHTKVDALHKTLAPDALRDDVAEVKEMLRELKSDIRDVMAMFLAVQKLLQEILDTDRSILLDLYEKSKK